MEPSGRRRLFRGSGLMRDKWDEPRGETTYGGMTLDRAIDCCEEVFTPGGARTNGTHSDESPEAWEQAIPLGGRSFGPPFPLGVLPGWLEEWVKATACGTQTPADLAALLALSVCGAALARKFRIIIRPGWCEPAVGGSSATRI